MNGRGVGQRVAKNLGRKGPAVRARRAALRAAHDEPPLDTWWLRPHYMGFELVNGRVCCGQLADRTRYLSGHASWSEAPGRDALHVNTSSS